MGKCVKTGVFTLLFICLLSTVCFAQIPELEAFLENAPEQIKNAEESELLSAASFNNAFNGIISLVFKGLQSASGIIAAACCLTMAMSLAGSFGSSQSVKSVFSAVCCTAMIGICFASVNTQIHRISLAAESAEVFSATAVPVISALSISGGESFAAVVFTSATSLCNTVFSFISGEALMPLCIFYLICGVVSGLSDSTPMSQVCEFIKKAVKWCVGLFTGVFTASISLQRFLSSASDSLIKRSVKTAVGAFIPVVGSALASGVEGMFVLAGNSRSTLSVIGVIAVCTIFLPVITDCLCCALSMSAVKALAGMLNVKQAQRSAAVIADTFYLLAGVCGTSLFLLTVSFLLICVSL